MKNYFSRGIVLCLFYLVAMFSCNEEELVVTEISRSLDKSGFHRNLRTEFVLDVELKPELKYCTVLLVESLPSGVYIDKDEVDSLAVCGGPTHFHFMNKIEIEKPSYLSIPLVVLIYSIYSGRKPINFSLSFPIHFRYHLSSSTESFTKIYLPPPLIYLSCSRDKLDYNQLFVKNNYTSVVSKQNPSYFKVVPKRVEAILTLQVDFPIGKLTDARLVTSLTLLATLVASGILIFHIHLYSTKFKFAIFEKIVKLKKAPKETPEIVLPAKDPAPYVPIQSKTATKKNVDHHRNPKKLGKRRNDEK